MLDTTRSAAFAPGTNRAGSPSGVPWLALMPSQEPARVLVVGVPQAAALRALARAADSLVVRCRTRRQARRARAILRGARADVAIGPAGGSDFDLIVVGRGEEATGLGDALAPGGALVVEQGRRRAGAGALPGSVIELTPSLGEVSAAVPAAAPDARRALQARGLWPGAVQIRAFGRSREIGGRLAGALPPRRIAVSWHSPPAYLCREAAAAGLDLAGFDWAMSAAGRYRSNKLVFFLFERGSDVPAFAVKMTRDAELNRRLAVEREALDRLAATGAVPAGSVPSVVFAGAEAGRALLGLTAIRGRPFPSVTTAGADDSHIARAFSWLEDLAATTMRPATGAELAVHLRDLFERFRGLYRLEDRHRLVLERGIDTIEASPATFPVVFQHGDPGAWNLLVAPDGAVAFLDWEAAEPRGVPLWDTFHLARSFAVLAGRAAGDRDMLHAIDRNLLSAGPVNRMLAAAVRGYRKRVGVPADLVEPLFHLSWMHRALKEATRLPASRLERSHYLALLRRGIDSSDRPGVRALVGGGD